MKYLIFDAGPIISLTMNGLLPVLEKLKEGFDGEFVVTPAVRKEILDKPLKIQKFKLEAMQVQKLFDKGVLVSSTKIVPTSKLQKESSRILKLANNSLKSTKTHQRIKIIHDGEASCMAFSNLCSCDNLIVIDERGTRILIESPESMKNLLSKKLGTEVVEVGDSLHKFKKQRFIRSAELMYVAHKKGYMQETTKEFLDAVLYALNTK